MAAALGKDCSLQSFKLKAVSTRLTNRFAAALDAALEVNFTLHSFVYEGAVKINKDAIDIYLDRNRQLQHQRRALTCLARPTSEFGLCSLKERCFRKMLFKYFVSKTCTLVPLELSASKKRAFSPDKRSFSGAEGSEAARKAMRK